MISFLALTHTLSLCLTTSAPALAAPCPHPGDLDDGTTGTDCRSIIVDNDHATHVAGHRSSHRQVKGRPYSFSNVFVRKYRASGKLAWTKSWDKKHPAVWNQGVRAAMGSDASLLVIGYGSARKTKQVSRVKDRGRSCSGTTARARRCDVADLCPARTRSSRLTCRDD